MININSKSIKYRMPKVRLAALSVLAAILVLTAACSVYRPEVQQGQRIDREQIDQLAHGMTKVEVMEILGTPLVADSFNRDRWDYVYYLLDDERVAVEQETLTILFANNQVYAIVDEQAEQADTLDDVDSSDSVVPDNTVSAESEETELEEDSPEEEKSFFRRLLDRLKPN